MSKKRASGIYVLVNQKLYVLFFIQDKSDKMSSFNLHSPVSQFRGFSCPELYLMDKREPFIQHGGGLQSLCFWQ